MIAKRAAELSIKYLDKKEIFDVYIKSQLAQCNDLDNNIVGVMWVLKKQIKQWMA